MEKGVFIAKKKDGTCYFRSSITLKNRHISLGSFSTEADAHAAYLQAKDVFFGNISIYQIDFDSYILPYDKIISLINFRDNDIYIKNPIYLLKGQFHYYLTPERILTFDNDDLFYYSTHKIQARGGHLFVSDFGMQYGILSRFGIKPFGVPGRDFVFANGDENDYSYSNIVIINHYHGVTLEDENGRRRYVAKIHIKGFYTLGRFKTEAEAAVAYNKATDYAKAHGHKKAYPQNYVLEYSPKEYAEIYTKIKLPQKFINYFESDKNK